MLDEKVEELKPTVIVARWLEERIPDHAKKETYDSFIKWLRQQDELPSYLRGREGGIRKEGLGNVQAFLKTAFMREQNGPLAYDPNRIYAQSRTSKVGTSGNPLDYLTR